MSSLTFAQTKVDSTNWIIKWNATSAIDIFTFPTVQFAVEKRLTNRFSVCAEFGSEFYKLYHSDSMILRPSGFKAYIQGRYYCSIFGDEKSQSIFKEYLDLQGFYRQNQYSAGVGYYTTSDSIHMKNDFFGVKKSVIGLNLVYGFEQTLYKRIIADVYFGFGGMYRRVRDVGRHYNPGSGDFIRGVDLVPLFENLNLSESSGFYFNVLFGIRIGLNL